VDSVTVSRNCSFIREIIISSHDLNWRLTVWLGVCSFSSEGTWTDVLILTWSSLHFAVSFRLIVVLKPEIDTKWISVADYKAGFVHSTAAISSPRQAQQTTTRQLRAFELLTYNVVCSCVWAKGVVLANTGASYRASSIHLNVTDFSGDAPEGLLVLVGIFRKSKTDEIRPNARPNSGQSR